MRRRGSQNLAGQITLVCFGQSLLIEIAAGKIRDLAGFALRHLRIVMGLDEYVLVVCFIYFLDSPMDSWLSALNSPPTRHKGREK